MSHRFKTAGLALLAVLALGAVGSASAQAGEFTWAGTTKNVDFVPDAKSLQKFGFSHAAVECNEMAGSAALTEGTIGGTEILTSSFTYDDSRAALPDACTGPGGSDAPFAMNGCNYRFTAGETVKGSTTETTAGNTHLVCPAGNKIKVGPIGCTIEIPTQTFEFGHIVYKQLGTFPSTVTAEVTITGLEYKQVGAGCSGGEGSFFNGTYSGNIIVSGTDKNKNLTAFGVK